MKFASGILMACVALCCLLLPAGCGGLTNPDQIVFPATNVSFSQQVEPYFQLACNSTGCHNSTDQAGGISLVYYADVMALGLCAPKDTSTSIVEVMLGQIKHAAPFIANANQREGIKEWVLEGAQDN